MQTRVDMLVLLLVVIALGYVLPIQRVLRKRYESEWVALGLALLLVVPPINIVVLYVMGFAGEGGGIRRVWGLSK